MKTYRGTAMAVGLLYAAGTVAGILSLLFTKEIFASSDFLGRIAADPAPLRAGAFCVLVMALSLAAMPVFLYPLFKRENPALAMGMVVFRGPLEACVYMATVLSWLLLAAFAERGAAFGAEAASTSAVVWILRMTVDIAAPMNSIIFCIGAMFLYILFFRTRLVPRWLTAWGIGGTALYLLVYLVKFFDLPPKLDLLVLPLAVQEMAMALRLIFKGFDLPALEALLARGN